MFSRAPQWLSMGLGALDPDPAGYLVNLVDPGRIRIWPDPNPMYLDRIQFGSGSNVSVSGSDPARSEVGSGKYWPDLHNYDIKHHSIYSFQEMTRDNTELYTKTR